MKDFDQLMSVWQEQPKKDQLSVDDVLRQAKKGINSESRKLLWSITSMFLSLGGLVVVMLFFVFTSWITYLGIFIIVTTIVLYAVMMIRDYRILSAHDVTVNPAAYMESLKEYQRNRAKVYGWMYYLYVVLISAGLLLYFSEVLQSASTTFKIAAYGLTCVWLLFCTFYLKNRFVKSEQYKLNLIIDRLVRLQNQFD